MTKFAIIHDLDGLSQEQTDAYLRAVSEHFGLPPELNAFDVLWMDAGDGKRKKVVYARKGTTDILRDLRGIEIESLVQHDGPGYVSFMATGRINGKLGSIGGRQEIAVGAHSTEGLRGQKLADAVMTAQTRALRRLTLQFVGGGILDVSEVGTTTDINASPASLAQLAGSAAVLPPQTAPIAPAPSKDITEEPAPQVIKEGVVNTGEVVNLQIKVDNPQEKAVNAPEQTSTATIEQPKKRTRKKRNTVSLASPGQDVSGPVQIEMPVGQIDAKGTITPISPEAPVSTSVEKTPNADIPQSQLTATPLPQSALLATASINPPMSPEKKKEYMDRIRKYSQDILPRAGMTPTEGVGGVTMKLRKFAEKFVGATDLNEQQSETLLTFLDDYVKQHGTQALVQHVDQAIGVTNS